MSPQRPGTMGVPETWRPFCGGRDDTNDKVPDRAPSVLEVKREETRRTHHACRVFMAWMSLGGATAQAYPITTNPYLYCGLLHYVSNVGWGDCREVMCDAYDGYNATYTSDGFSVTVSAGVDFWLFNVNPCPEYMPDCEVTVSFLWFSAGVGCTS